MQTALGRKCNECTLCCRLMPVKEFSKPANQRCKYQRTGKGCAIHSSETYPKSCHVWSCVWLMNPDTKELPRPDRAHYVIDPSQDFIEVDLHNGQPRLKISVIQIWIDPKYPDAHRDPALRTWLEQRAARFHQVALVRYPDRATVLFPPELTGNTWVEKSDGHRSPEHTPEEIAMAHGQSSLSDY